MRISRRELFAGLLGSLAVSSRPEVFLVYPGVKVGSWTRELPPGPMIRYCADPGAGVAPEPFYRFQRNAFRGDGAVVVQGAESQDGPWVDLREIGA